MDSISTSTAPAAAMATAAPPQPQPFQLSSNYNNTFASPMQSLQLSNPFVLRVGQMMTGFGVGCGIGIGVGRPLKLGAIPVINQMVGSGDIFQSLGSTGRHVQNLIRRLGIKNVEAGIGCGIGLGHGFGVGLSLKPGTGQQLLHFFQNVLQSLAKQVKLPVSNNVGTSIFTEESSKRGLGNFSAVAQTFSGIATPGTDPPRFVASPSYPLNSGVAQADGVLEQLKRLEAELTKTQAEKEILMTLLRHQRQIEELKEELAALKVVYNTQIECHFGADKDGLETTKLSGQRERSTPMFSLYSQNSCSKCFHCRRQTRH